MTILFWILTSFSLCFSQVDPYLTPEAKNLYDKLNNLSLSMHTDHKILLGQQHAFHEGLGWRKTNSHVGEPLISDIEQVSGIHPGLLGLDMLEIGKWNYEITKYHMREVHRRNGVVTISFHMKSLVDDGVGDGGFWDTSARVVEHVLPGKMHHEKLVGELNRFVALMKDVPEVPVIFRPWHEHTGSWFWWGQNHCTQDEYISLWRFTVNYLKSQGVHNVLYAYSPSYVDYLYLERWPGDNYVDIMGTDAYFKTPAEDVQIFGANDPLGEWKDDLIWLLKEASARNKIPAITEFGQMDPSYARFWTDYLGWPILKDGIQQRIPGQKLPARGFAYIMLWRQHTLDPKMVFGPFPGHTLNDNFLALLSAKNFVGLDRPSKLR